MAHEALHGAPITFVSREIHSETFRSSPTIVAQIPAMTLDLFEQEWKVT
jgi:hypothetical protein